MGQCRLELITTGFCHSLEALVVENGRWRTIQQPFVVGLLTHPERGQWLIDTGLHPRLWTDCSFWVGLFMKLGRIDLAESLEDQLARRDFKPQGIFLTHLHIDHVAGLRDFPGIPVITSRQGYDKYRLAGGWAGLPQGADGALLPTDLEDRALWLEDFPTRPVAHFVGRDLFGDGSVLAVPLPGHALGQHGLWVEVGEGPVFMTGDACGVSRILEENVLPRLPRLISHDWEAEKLTVAELRRLRQERPEVPLVPSHCPTAWRR